MPCILESHDSCTSSVSFSQITFVDFILYELFDQNRIFEPTCLNGFEKLKKFLDRFEVTAALRWSCLAQMLIYFIEVFVHSLYVTFFFFFFLLVTLNRHLKTLQPT